MAEDGYFVLLCGTGEHELHNFACDLKVFVCSGASSQPTTWDKEEKDDKKREDKEKRKGKEDGRKQTDTEEEDVEA